MMRIDVRPYALRIRDRVITSDDVVARASWDLDQAAISYAMARLDRKYPKLQRLAKEMKDAAMRLATALRAEEK